MRYALVFCIWLAGHALLSAQGYYIKDYQVDLHLDANAALQVTEHIEVYFQQERRGIIRSIPYQGASVLPSGGEVAWRSQYGDRYTIHLEDIRVEGHPFTTYTQDGYQYIRIGDPDVYLTGDQQYTIRYTVYGAVQEFADHAELPWNVIGNEWDTRIEQASFTLSYPGGGRVQDKDFLAFTGYRGSTQNTLDVRKMVGAITGTTGTALNAGQGITIALRLPKAVFTTLDIPVELITRHFVVENLETELRLGRDGATHVTERLTINALGQAPGFLRILSLPPGTDAHDQTVYPLIQELSVRIKELGQGQYSVSLYPSREQTLLEITPEQPFSGVYHIRLDYTVWGAATATDQGIVLQWNIFSTTAPEPVEHYALQAFLPPGYSASGDMALPYPKQVRNELAEIRSSADSYSVESRKRVISGDQLMIALGVDGSLDMLDNLPQQVYAREYWIEHADQTMTVQRDGSINVKANYYPRFRYRQGTSSFHLNVPLGQKRERDASPFFQGHNILGRSDRYYYRFNELGKLDAGPLVHPYQQLNIASGIPAEQADFLSVDYTVKGVMQSQGQEAFISYPVWIPVGEPLRGATVRIAFEGAVRQEEVTGSIATGNAVVIDTLAFTGKAWEAYIPDERYSDEPIYAQFYFPKQAASRNNFFSGLALFWLNNKPLVLSLGIMLLLLGLWRLIGKDTPGTIIARYQPPEGMPPSEAGFIYDGKLHDHDMTALIYYWGAQGFLKIREIPGEKKKKPDFEFVKLMELTSDAREYERIFFDGLFATGDEVKLSSLKNSFYKSYERARKAFSQFETKAGYYARGTRGLGRFLIFLGLLAGLASLALLAYSLYVKDYSYSIPAIIVSVSLVVFGRIMPRMKSWAQEALDELMGFREFIRTAEQERLKTLIDEDPHYFGMTLPYAVVMGLGKAWAEKFEDILIAPPDWYEGYDRPFTPYLFTNHMIHSMHDMKSTFTSTPAPVGGSGSSWSGGSSFGGGFSGGGGFGGGGGGSW